MGTNLSRTATTDDLGEYTVPLLPVGTYSARVEHPGGYRSASWWIR
ncbi:MAG: carboxypeptidase-like regulatory domain-containing protein [Bryobacteraceae bacterium]